MFEVYSDGAEQQQWLYDNHSAYPWRVVCWGWPPQYASLWAAAGLSNSVDEVLTDGVVSSWCARIGNKKHGESKDGEQWPYDGRKWLSRELTTLSWKLLSTKVRFSGLQDAYLARLRRFIVLSARKWAEELILYWVKAPRIARLLRQNGRLVCQKLRVSSSAKLVIS